jgi:hypothetical protein
MTSARIAMIGAAVLVSGGTLLGVAVTASAASPTISFTQTGPIDPGTSQTVFVTASGMAKKSPGALFECSKASPQPTIDVPLFVASLPNPIDLGQLPVSCSGAAALQTTKKGTFPTTGFSLTAGILGPPASGTDSANNDGATDAASFPCPPTTGQAAGCEVLFVDAAGDKATMDVSYSFDGTTTTTTTLAPVANCTAAPATGTGGTAKVTVNPATCLTGGQSVSVTGSGLFVKSLGSILECNGATGEPTVLNSTVGTKPVPVGCTDPFGTLAKIISTDATGSLPATAFTVNTGTLGPPGSTAAGCSQSCLGAETGGSGNPTADAANYPCPPTAAQVAAGATCALVYGDLGGDAVVVPISFGANAGSSAAAAKAAAASTTKAASTAKAAATKSSSSKLAFTGAGPGLWVMGVAGVVLLMLGLFLLVLVDGPRRVLRLALHQNDRTSSSS